MNNPLDSLRFPSGASVSTVKKDARQLAKAKGITHTAALNELASRHGLELLWDRAMEFLSEEDGATNKHRFAQETIADILCCWPEPLAALADSLESDEASV